MRRRRPAAAERMGPAWPLGAAALTVAFWRLPHGKQLLYPFSMLADWFHEMGHGATAVLLGGRFQRLLLYPNGTGQAISAGKLLGGRLGWAAVAAGGPLGAPAAGYFLIRLSRRPGPARACLWALGATLLVSAALWMRTGFGFAFAAAMGSGVVWAAAKPLPRLHVLLAQFMGVQACVSVFKELDYIFSARAVVNGVPMASDSAELASLAGGPRLAWGILLASVAVLLFGLSLRAAFAPAPTSGPRG